MQSKTVYSTVTKGHGDRRATRFHAVQIARMVASANITHYTGCPTRTGNLNCTCPALDDSGLPR